MVAPAEARAVSCPVSVPWFGGAAEVVVPSGRCEVLMLIADMQLSVTAPPVGNATRAVPPRRPLEMVLVVVRVLASVEVSEFEFYPESFSRDFAALSKHLY